VPPQLPHPQRGGGRQSARSIHFIAAWALVGFLLVHLVMLLLSAPFAKIRGMIDGRG
jgi:thiosulfate reductase cytochrome b subunit